MYIGCAFIFLTIPRPGTKCHFFSIQQVCLSTSVEKEDGNFILFPVSNFAPEAGLRSFLWRIPAFSQRSSSASNECHSKPWGSFAQVSFVCCPCSLILFRLAKFLFDFRGVWPLATMTLTQSLSIDAMSTKLVMRWKEAALHRYIA